MKIAIRRISSILAIAVFFSTSSSAQIIDSNQAIIDETNRIKAETDLESAKAERAKAEIARVQVLGIPSFSGKTELATNAGAMEVNLLASNALGSAASEIAANTDVSVLLLAGDEAVDFGAADAMKQQLQAIQYLYGLAGLKVPVAGSATPGADAAFLPPAAAVAAISAVAGLFRAETTISGTEASAVTQQMLVAAVASRLAGAGRPAMLANTRVAGVQTAAGISLYRLLNDLGELRYSADQQKSFLSGVSKPTPAQRLQLASLVAATTRHDAFLAKAFVADNAGVVPFAAAARMAGVFDDGRQILRVYINKAGGSVVNTRNIATIFGVDPVKVSGGVLVSYVRSDPKTGDVKSSDVLSCDTTLTGIRSVQERRWNIKRPSSIRHKLCSSIFSGST